MTITFDKGFSLGWWMDGNFLLTVQLDAWDELKILDEIKIAETRILDLTNFTVDQFGNKAWKTTLASGQKIKIVKTPSGILKSAYPFSL